MQTARIRTEELVGLGAAVVLHAALLAVLLTKPQPAPPPPLPDRIAVSLAEDVGLEAASPTPVAESRMATAPQLSDLPAPPVTEPAPAARSAPVETPSRQVERAPQRTERPAREKPKEDRRERRRPDREQAQRSTPKEKAGGGRISENFLDGAGSSSNTNETRPPAATFGAREQAALTSAINRQLRPHWRAPQGVDVDKLVTVLRFRLNKDGSLSGRPQLVRQTGVNDANRAQAEVHAERAIRAVQLAAPFNLPEEFYDKWKYISEWRFDRRL